MKPLSKPLLRGHFHQAAFFVALGACAMLISNAHGFKTIVATLIYSISLVVLFGVSALYHRPNWKPNQRMWMKRIDHAAIYFLIAGTSTPVFLISLQPETAFRLLYFVWGAAIFGFLQSIFWVTAPKWISAIIYVVVGCFSVPYIPELNEGMPLSNLVLIITGGAVYIIGALIYAMKRPNPSPQYFGYHEIFHTLVIVGATLHFLVIARMVS